MKKIFNNNFRVLIVFLLMLLITPRVFYGEANENSNDSLSLQDAIRIAFNNNKDIQIQEKEIEVARANILGVQSAFLPKVNLGAEYKHNGAILNLGSSAGAKKDIGIFSGYKNDNKLGITIDESIYNGGASIANFKGAKLGLSISEETLRAKNSI